MVEFTKDLPGGEQDQDRDMDENMGRLTKEWAGAGCQETGSMLIPIFTGCKKAALI